MIVCICNNINCAAVKQAIQNDCRNVRQVLKFHDNACTAKCGSCIEMIQSYISDSSSSETAPK